LYSAMVGFDGKLKCREGKYTKEDRQKRQPQLNPNAARGSQVRRLRFTSATHSVIRVMGKLDHTRLGSSYLIAHVLRCPPPPPAHSFIIGPAVINTHPPCWALAPPSPFPFGNRLLSCSGPFKLVHKAFSYDYLLFPQEQIKGIIINPFALFANPDSGFHSVFRYNWYCSCVRVKIRYFPEDEVTGIFFV
jgi:hypothetical protein